MHYGVELGVRSFLAAIVVIVGLLAYDFIDTRSPNRYIELTKDDYYGDGAKETEYVLMSGGAKDRAIDYISYPSSDITMDYSVDWFRESVSIDDFGTLIDFPNHKILRITDMVLMEKAKEGTWGEEEMKLVPETFGGRAKLNRVDELGISIVTPEGRNGYISKKTLEGMGIEFPEAPKEGPMVPDGIRIENLIAMHNEEYAYANRVWNVAKEVQYEINEFAKKMNGVSTADGGYISRDHDADLAVLYVRLNMLEDMQRSKDERYYELCQCIDSMVNELTMFLGLHTGSIRYKSENMNKMAGVYIAKLSKDINEQYEFYWATKGRANRIDYDYYKNEEARRLSVSAAVRKAKEEMDRKIWATAEAKRQEILKKERAEQAERELREQEILREFKEAEEQRAREAMAEASELPEIPEDEIIEPTIDIENENEQPEGAQTEGGQVVDGEGQEVELPENGQNDVDLQENEMQSTGDLVIEDDAVPLHRVEDESISKSEVEGVESVVDTDLIN